MTTETTDTSNRTTEPESTRDVPVYRSPTDIHDTGKAVVLTLEMPGVGRDDVDIDLERRVLSIRGRGRVTSPEGYRLVHAEYGEGDYERVFTLSEWCCPRLTGHLGGLLGASELAWRAHP
jgi:HSP20 family molecular chaperone IbpA